MGFDFPGLRHEEKFFGEGSGKKYYKFIAYLKCLACLLITNSHCGGIYPIPFLALGGGWGNAIFFIVSGFCLARIEDDFAVWIKRRLNIIPVTMIFIIFDALILERGVLAERGAWEIAAFYLNKYWFVFAILLYYFAFYGLFRHPSIERFKKFAAGYVAGYIVLYLLFLQNGGFFVEAGGFAPFKVYFYFSVFVTGGILKYMEGWWAVWCGRRRGAVLFCCGFSLALWGAAYIGVTFFDAYRVQFLINAAVLFFGVTIFIFAYTLEDNCRDNKTVWWIAGSTLEIYLVQMTVINHVVEKIAFPASLFVFFGIAVIGGGMVHAFWSWMKLQCGK